MSIPLKTPKARKKRAKALSPPPIMSLEVNKQIVVVAHQSRTPTFDSSPARGLKLAMLATSLRKKPIGTCNGIVSQQDKPIRLTTGIYTAAARATVEGLLYSTNSRLSGCQHIPVNLAEQEGLEPPTPFRAAAFKAVSSSSQVCSTANTSHFTGRAWERNRPRRISIPGC